MDNRQVLISRYAKVVKKGLEEGRVLSCEFSGPTYQVEVKDPTYQETLWPFLQLDAKDKIKDLFCGCDDVDEKGGCPHAALALAYIFNKDDTPLHRRFEQSLFNALGALFAQKVGYEVQLVKKEQEGHYKIQDLFVAKAKGKNAEAFLKALFSKKPNATEETSLKFSNLPQDEILRWKEGRASPALLYELSFWSDLAKHLFFKNSQGPLCRVEFEEKNEGLPTAIFLHFKDLYFSFALTPADWPAIIAPLKGVNSSLKVMANGEKGVEKITYDVKQKAFKIVKKAQEQKTWQGVKVDGWQYIKGMGFVKQKGASIWDNHVIKGQEMAPFLDANLSAVQALLVNEKVHDEVVKINYAIAFDTEWNLTIRGYLFEPKDLHALFGSWGYVKGKGFYRVTGNLFEEQEKKVSAWHVSEFVGEHRVWLNEQEGFATHLLPIDAPLTYKVDAGSLFFESAFAKKGDAKDFGDWIFVKGEGFFAKKQTAAQAAIVPGLEVVAVEIPSFIKENSEELEGIPRFFLTRSPLIKRTLKVELSAENRLVFTPIVEVQPEYRGKELLFFEEFVFVNGEGFFELPPPLRLPTRFSEPITLPKDLTPYFLRYEIHELASFLGEVDPRLLPPKKVDLHLEYLAKNPGGGLKGRFYIQTERGALPLSTLKEASLKKRGFVFHEAGLIDLKDERWGWLSHFGETFDVPSNTATFSTLEFLRLEATEKVFAPTEESPLAQTTKALLKELRDFTSLEPYDLSGLKSELRGYQKAGVNWLWFLYRNDLAGLLCDEMGLGKTHQALALMATILNKIPQGPLRFLVVCPTSVIYHWEDKLARFLPKINVHLFHGFKRSLKKLPKRAVLLTTYGIVRQEQETLKNMPFELAVYDEIQSAKNAKSRLHQALAKMKSKMCVGLTGTPIENNLKELKALFDIVLPTYMPSEAKYKEHFIKPIEREGDAEKKAALRALVHPFLLRRKKREVLDELPAKIEEKAYIDLSEKQLELYNNTLNQSKNRILQELNNESQPIPYIHIFALLMQLKQICNHPALFAKDPKGYKKYQSGKFDLFVELMDEINESEQKVVVFSQYLQMLDIIELFVKEKRWGYAQIRGDTQNRKEEIERFQTDPNCRVFIGSLGAAGVGIDLTAASNVILYDRWWNPARENQAIDRVHRIGQKWGVQVFKLITKGTIEERIEEIVVSKQKLMEEVIGSDDQDAIKTLSREDLISLLQL